MKGKSGLIFETAVRMFLKHGYSNTSMDDVAKEAGVSKQTIYNNFVNKENILRKIVSHKSQEYYRDIENVEATKENFEKLLEKFCKNFLKLVTDPKLAAIHRIVLSEMQNNPDITKTFFITGPAKTYDVLEAFFDSANKNEIISIDSPREVADNVISMLKGQYYMELLFGVRKKITTEEFDTHLKGVLGCIKKLIIINN